VEASAVKGERLLSLLTDRMGGHPNVGEIRGRGLLVGVELVADRATRRSFARSARFIEAVMGHARAAGLLLYHGTGNAEARTATPSCWGRRSWFPTGSCFRSPIPSRWPLNARRAEVSGPQG